MLPPYAPEEVAQAVMAALSRTGGRVARLTVTADDLAREWCLAGQLADGSEVVARFPFSVPEGIHTPAEIAGWFVERIPGDE